MGHADTAADQDSGSASESAASRLDFADLPTLSQELIDQPVHKFFLELFSGEAIFTLALVMASVPVLHPWDTAFGSQFDVVAGLSLIIAAIRSGLVIVVHLGTPCRPIHSSSR